MAIMSGREPNTSLRRLRQDATAPLFKQLAHPARLAFCGVKQKTDPLHNARIMRAFALLALSLVGAAQGSNLLYPKGCSDASKANYYSNNPDSEAECWPLATVYCPDPLADNYNAASCKLRPRTSRMPCPPLLSLLCPHLLVAPMPTQLLAHWLVHTHAPDA